MQKTIDDWLAMKIIRLAPGASQWNSPMLVNERLLSTGDISHRVCIDPRLINDHTLVYKRQHNTSRDVLYSMTDSVCFSTLDLAKAFNQLPMYPPHAEYTSFTFDNKRYEFIGAPFGLKNIPAFFQGTFDLSFPYSPHLIYILPHFRCDALLILRL